MGTGATRATRLAAGKVADWRKRPGKNFFVNNCLVGK